MSKSKLLKPEIRKMQSIYWSRSALANSKLPNFTALQKLVLPKSFKKRSEDEPWNTCSYIFNKYSNGTRSASKKTVLKTNLKVPGSKYFYFHPFWEIINNEFLSIDELNAELIKLKPRVVDILFSDQRDTLNRRKRREIDKLFKVLVQLEAEADLDAFSAVIGILVEYRQFGRYRSQYKLFAVVHVLLVHLSAHSALEYVAHDLINYIYSEFYFYSEAKEDKLDEFVVNLKSEIEIHKYSIRFLKASDLFRHVCPTPEVFLYTAQIYIYRDIKNISHKNNQKMYLTSKCRRIFQSYVIKWEREVNIYQNPYYSPFIPEYLYDEYFPI